MNRLFLSLLAIFVSTSSIASADQCSKWASDAHKNAVAQGANNLILDLTELMAFEAQLKCGETSKKEFCANANRSAQALAASTDKSFDVDFYEQNCSGDAINVEYRTENNKRSNKICHVAFNFASGTLGVEVFGIDRLKQGFFDGGKSLGETLAVRNRMVSSGYCDSPNEKNLPVCELEKVANAYSVSIGSLRYSERFETEIEAKTKLQSLVVNSACR